MRTSSASQTRPCGPSCPTSNPSQQDRLDAESNYFVAVNGKELDLAPPADLDTDSFSPTMTERPGCRRFTATNATPTLIITSFLGAGFRFRGDASRSRRALAA